MAEPAREAETLDQVVAQLARQSRRRIPIAAIGLLLILASFGYFIINLRTALHQEAQARVAAEQGRANAEKRANELADTLEEARVAYTKQEFGEVGRLLKAAIKEVEQTAQTVRAPTDGPAPLPTPQLSPSPTPTSPPVSIATTNFRQPVFIQFAGLLERAQIVALNRTLKDAGWNMQSASGERTGRAAGLNEVRYAGDNREAAEALAKALTQIGLTGPVKVQEVPIVKQNLEVWISKT